MNILFKPCTMPDTITIRGMRNRAARFLKCRTFEDIALLLRKEPLKLLALALAPAYREFCIPKKNGGYREIEDPVPPLKKMQRRLNDYLQAVYFFHRTPAAYGFLTNPVDDPSPRHILTNAQVHMGCQWMLNIDMKDFFHTIPQEKVEQLFQSSLFSFSDEASQTLASLCCHKERLPMGAPTSPILSNLVCIPLDKELGGYAAARDWRYTRYADDMTFSARTQITDGHFKEIEDCIRRHDFRLNPVKKRLYGPSRDTKEVTGLIVREEEIDLPDDYLSSLQQAIKYLDQVVDAKQAMPSGRYSRKDWVDELRQQVRGKLEFARQILGEDDDEFLQLEAAFEAAIETPDFYGPLQWLDFGYTDVKF